MVTEELVLFLNPDTQVKPGTLVKALSALRDNAPPPGIVGVANYNGLGELRPSCARFPTPQLFFAKSLGLDVWLSPKRFSSFDLSWDYRSNRIVDQIIGAFFLMRKQSFEQLGGFDERFFMYFEEVDLSRRAHQLGLFSLYVADAGIVHQGGASAAKSSGLALGYSILSRSLYAAKHFSAGTTIATILFSFTVEFPLRLAHALSGRGFFSLRETFTAFSFAFRRIPKEVLHMWQSDSEAYRYEQ